MVYQEGAAVVTVDAAPKKSRLESEAAGWMGSFAVNRLHETIMP